MEVTCRFQDSDPLDHGERPPVPPEQEAGLAPERVWNLWGKIFFLPCLESNTISSDHLARRPVATETLRYPTVLRVHKHIAVFLIDADFPACC
jgi:hypothetical protein